jgi:hypothetical protein
MLTNDVLHKRGIDLSDEEFAALLDDALDGPAMAVEADPVRTLTPPETAALTAGGADLRPRGAEEPAPRSETAATYGALLAGALTVGQAAALLKVDASRVRHRLAEGSLYGIRLRTAWRLPAFQFQTDGGVVPGMDAILAAVPHDLHPVALWRWLTTPLADLADLADLEDGGSPLSPLDWLAGGGPPAVVAAVAGDL